MFKGLFLKMSYKIYALRYTCISWTHETQTTIIHKTTLKYLLIFFYLCNMYGH